MVAQMESGAISAAGASDLSSQVEKVQEVAVIGTGIAGLSIAYLLSSKTKGTKYKVTVFERESELGMDAHALNVDEEGHCSNGKPQPNLQRINTPPRAFSKGYYPNLMELYRVSGVEVSPWSWAYNYAIFGEDSPYIRVGNSRIMGYRLPDFNQWWKLFSTKTLYLAVDFFKFHYHIRKDMWNEEISNTMTLREYMKYINVSDEFVYEGLLPILSMICTCSYEACLNYPVDIIMHYYFSNSTHGQYRTTHGTRDAVTKLSAHVHRVVTNAKVEKVWRSNAKTGERAKILYADTNNNNKKNLVEFDFVIVATQANHALKMVENLSDEMKSILEKVKHETSTVIIHRDPIVMPKDRRDWNPMNAMVSPKNDQSMFTIWMNDAYKELADNMFQTWNPIVDIKDSMVYQKIYFERPLVTHESLEAVARMKKVNGTDDIWYCSAWNAHRIPLQESGVTSALNVFRALTGEEPEGNFIDGHNHFDVIKLTRQYSEKAKQKALDVGTSVSSVFFRDESIESTDIHISGKVKALASVTISFAVVSVLLRANKLL